MNIQNLSALSEIAPRFDALLCDIWGVLHNGVHAYPFALQALERFKGPIILISNSPRRAKGVAKQIEGFGFLPKHYDDILTSGEASHLAVKQRVGRGEKIYHLGPMRDIGVFEGLEEGKAELEKADAVLITGLLDDESEVPEDYRGVLGRALERGLPVLCANPDRQVMRGSELVYCAGALADIYAEMGGEVLWFGKPHAPIYEQALGKLAGLGVVEKEKVLALGDGVHTDILGAQKAGLASVLIAGGLIGAGAEGAVSIADICRKYEVSPLGVLAELRW